MCMLLEIGVSDMSVYDINKNDLVNEMSGLRLSLLGDSVSAYVGTIPSNNHAFYKGSNCGVSSPDQMWWKVLCDELGMTPLIIDGHAGSAISWLEDADHRSKIPMSDNSRCGRLGNISHNPDIIVIAGGLNDYTYAQSAQSEPLPWDGKTAPTEGNSFTETYACMLKKLQTNYPQAMIACLSSWFTMRGTDNGYTLTHAVGSNVYTQADYDSAIEYVCDKMNTLYIDVSNIGFNRSNFYPNFTTESTNSTHPNAAGHKIMGLAIASKLPILAKAFFK